MQISSGTMRRKLRSAAALGEDPRLGARALGLLYLAGATIGLVSLLLPHPPGANVPGLYSNVGLAYAGGATLLAAASRIRGWMLHIAIALGALLITRACVLSEEAASFYSVWFIWIGLYVFYFFSRSAAAVHMAFVAGLYAITLAHRTPTSAVARWLTTVATLIVAGVLIDTLVRLSRRQASAAAGNAESMALITELAHQLTAVSDSAAARQALCEGALRVTQATHGVLWEPAADEAGADHPSLVATAHAGVPEVEDPGAFEPSVRARQALSTGRPIACGGADPRTGKVPLRHPGAEPPLAWLWLPIHREAATIGVLELGWPDLAAIEDRSRMALTRLLAVEAAVTLQRMELLTELQTMARTDELTGLPNRRAWQEHLPRELARGERTDQSLTVAMLDLDHFKRFNDAHGHLAGDRLLKQVAAAWMTELRPSDMLCRYGGEEFALVLPSCAGTEALEVVERLRAAIPGDQTCSAGMAVWDGAEPATSLVERADRALYGAKRSGRRRTTVAGGTASLAPASPGV